jgi:hypothetical protein
VGQDSLVVGIHWIDADGTRREPLVYQSVHVRAGRIAHIQDHRTRPGALRDRGR